MKTFTLEFTNEGQELNYSEIIKCYYKEDAKKVAEDKVKALKKIMIQGSIGCKVMNSKYHELYII